MKIKCTKCEIEKDSSCFYYRKTENRFQSYCKTCLNAYQTTRWIARKVWAVEYLGGICQICKQSYHYSAFDFHHRVPEDKEMVWDKMRLVSKQTMVKELDKCDLLCSNCHRILHSIH